MAQHGAAWFGTPTELRISSQQAETFKSAQNAVRTCIAKGFSRIFVSSRYASAASFVSNDEGFEKNTENIHLVEK